MRPRRSSSSTMDSDFPFLPPEIIRNIMKRLPVKSLMRFQFVCRGWRILFKTQSFIADHLDHSKNQNPCLLMKDYDLDDPSNMYSNMYCLDSEMQVWEFQNPPLLSYLKQGNILNSSNGLLCVEIDKHDASPHFLLVWNPAIREVRLVPETNIRNDNCFDLIGFGFSPIINDYKIVVAYFPIDHANVSAVKVYSLSSGSWNEEKKFRLNDIGGVSSPGVTVKGVMFWWGYKTDGEDDDEDLIVSFDLAVEVFTVIPTPQLHPNSYFTVYEEKLALFSWIKDPIHVIDMWVMEEGVGASGEIWSWTGKYSIDPFPSFLSFETIWRNEIVFFSLGKGDESTIVFLNLITKKTLKFSTSKSGYKEWIFNYAESLVPVGGMKSSTLFL